MALPQPPDTTPLAQTFEAMRALAVATSGLTRVGRFTMPTNTSGTAQRVDFDMPFPAGTQPIVMASVAPTSTTSILWSVNAGLIDEYGFTCFVTRSSGSLGASSLQYLAVAQA